MLEEVKDMDVLALQRMTADKAKKRFGSHEVLYSKYIPQIPASAEREYVRVSNSYMRILKEELERELPKLREAYKANRDGDAGFRHDGATDIILAVTQVFNAIKNRVTVRTSGFGLRRKLENLANLNRKLTVKEWKRAVKATLGIDIREDYYLGDFYSEQLVKWVDENVSLIKTIPQDTLDKMKDIVYDGFENGKTTTRMVKDIQNAYGISRRRAELIARDQTAKLNGQIQRAQQMDAGITEYMWYSCHDERVRQRHRELDGQKFSWNEPPVVDAKTGRRCHPGQDYQCRCIGRPVFDRNTITLPVADDGSAVAGSRKQPFGMGAHGSRPASSHSIVAWKEPDENDVRTVQEYMSFQSYVVNEKLREGLLLTEEEKSFTVQLDSTLKKMPRYRGSVTRSLYFRTEEDVREFIKRYAVGSLVVYDEYISTTKGSTYNPDGQVQIYIPRCTKGRDITGLNAMEQEILYERNSAFRVKSIRFRDGKYHIKLEEAEA